MILVIDNYDSYTYNLVHAFGELGAEVAVFRNDQIDIPSIERLAPSGIVISPGPGSPGTAGISNDVIRSFAGKVPILGVCLGHQCIGEVYGSKVVRAARVMHGKTSSIYHDGSSLYAGVPSPFAATRYHSLLIDPSTLTPDLIVTSQTEDGEIMGVRHRHLDVEGVQFHPESIMTTYGPVLLANFLRRTGISSLAEPAARPRVGTDAAAAAALLHRLAVD